MQSGGAIPEEAHLPSTQGGGWRYIIFLQSKKWRPSTQGGSSVQNICHLSLIYRFPLY